MKLGAPDYMWHGIVSFILLGVLITFALVPDRFRLHRDYPSFKYWHRVLAIATIGTATYHIVVSNFYLDAWYQGALFAAFAIVVAFGRPLWLKLGQIPITRATVYVGVSLGCAVLFTALRNLRNEDRSFRSLWRGCLLSLRVPRCPCGTTAGMNLRSRTLSCVDCHHNYIVMNCVTVTGRCSNPFMTSCHAEKTALGEIGSPRAWTSPGDELP